MIQRNWHEVVEGERLPDLPIHLTVTRLVMMAGANRDFSPIHHNSEFARASGAPDMYANTFFLQGMWERCVRDYVGPAGQIRSLSCFTMNSFNTPGQTLVVEGRVLRKWQEDGTGLVELELLTRAETGISVGPGRIIAQLPMR